MLHACNFSCNMHAACMENIPNPCVTWNMHACYIHACRYKCNLYVPVTLKHAAHLNYACNVHVTCTRFHIGVVFIATWNVRSLLVDACTVLQGKRANFFNCGQNCFNAPNNYWHHKTLFLNFWFNLLSPYIANREAIQLRVVNFHKFWTKVVISLEYFRVETSNLGLWNFK